MPEIITRAEAKARGLRRYFTGKLCCRWHRCERYTKTMICVMCCERFNKMRSKEDLSRQNKKYRKNKLARDPDYYRRKDKAWREKNPELVKAQQRSERYKTWKRRYRIECVAIYESEKAKHREWSRANRTYLREYERERRMKEPEKVRLWDRVAHLRKRQGLRVYDPELRKAVKEVAACEQFIHGFQRKADDRSSKTDE